MRELEKKHCKELQKGTVLIYVSQVKDQEVFRKNMKFTLLTKFTKGLK